MPELLLEAESYRDARNWYWRLKDTATGDVLADHEVRLAADEWQYIAFLDLHGYLSHNAPPDQRREREVELVKQVGEWIAENVLGPIAAKIREHAKDAPLVVRVKLPADDETASGLLYCPLELAHVGGKPLSVQDVSFVFDLAGDGEPASRAVGDSLKFLAVFSIPTDATALNLRHERYQLKRSIRAIAATGRRIDLRVLQYGVTRQALANVLEEEDGWDVIHFSGHGLAAHLVLETPDGTADRVTTHDLLGLLRPARRRLKWVTLSACLSAAATIDETLRWLNLHQPDDPVREAEGDANAQAELREAAAAAQKDLPALAQALVRELDVAVLAMRYPVGDQFAIDLAQQVYGQTLEKGQPLPVAVQRGLPQAAAMPLCPPLSTGTVALFGRRAIDLRLSPPRGAAVADDEPRLAYFPPEPERFVGRVGILAAAREALAPNSGKTGLLLHGMAGGGKTACALELAYQYEAAGQFRHFVWFSAPEQGKDISTALRDFAFAMERQVPDLKLVHLMDNPADFTAMLPRLRRHLEEHAALVVLDNLESLLRDTGDWRDDRWGRLVATLLSHGGTSRVVLTSRVVPRVPAAVSIGRGLPPITFDENRLLTRPVHSLSRDHAALLARQLPNLGRLLRGEDAKTYDERVHHRDLVARALRLVQGHPKLIDLAEGQAATADGLAAHLDRAERAKVAGDAALAAFFAEGESRLTDDQFLETLAAWTKAVAEEQAEDARRMFYFLCCLEDDDRTPKIAATVWPQFVRRVQGGGEAGTGAAGTGLPPEVAELLQRADTSDPAAMAKLLQDPRMIAAMQAINSEQEQAAASTADLVRPLVAAGLVDRRVERAEGGGERQVWSIHPGVAESGRDLAGVTVRDAVDAELGGYWIALFRRGIETESAGGGAIVRVAGLRAAPYLMRAKRWNAASTLMENVVQRDASAATVAAVLPLLRRVAAATVGTDRELIDAGVLADVLLAAGQGREAEAMLLDVAERAEQQESWHVASATLGSVINLMRATGRLAAALNVVERKKRATRQAGLGPWTQLGIQSQRLQLLAEIGRHEEVLAEVERLRPEMADLPEQGEAGESVDPYNVRETLLDTGRSAALGLERWEQALSLSEAVQDSKRARGASPLEQARIRFNDYAPLLRLERYSEVATLLQECRLTFEVHNPTELGDVFGAQADLQTKLGRHDLAAAAAGDALRYTYPTGEVAKCAINHFNLANYLWRLGAVPGSDADPAAALAHRLACAVIRFQTASGGLPNALQAFAGHLASLPPDSPARELAAADGSGFGRVVELVEQVEGVRFAALFEALPKDRAQTGPEALATVLELAEQAAAEGPADGGEMPPQIRQFLEGIAATAAAEGMAGVDAKIAELKPQLLSKNPGQEDQIDGLLARIREAVAESLKEAP